MILRTDTYLSIQPFHGAFLYYIHVNEALKKVADKDKMTGFVSAEGLGANPDNLHFSAEAHRAFGVRYYNEFVKLEDKNKVFEEKSTPDQAVRNDIEHL